MQILRFLAFMCIVLMGLWLQPAAAEQVSMGPEGAATAEEEPSNSLKEIFFAGFDMRTAILAYGIYRDPVDSPLAYYNNLNISQYQLETDFRPDLRFTYQRLELLVKPRLDLSYQNWGDEPNSDQNDRDADIYVNEWLARGMLSPRLFASYGRENLQWGPAYLISPSNPFNRINGRNNPKIEVPGLDYGRMVWVPSSSWTSSFIANTGEGQMDFFGEFEKAYAVKIDYTGNEKYFSVIPAYRESNEYSGGFFGGWSVSDAMLLYTDGTYEDDGPNVDVGVSYTLEWGPTLSAEYYHNSNGCTGPIEFCYPPFGDANPDEGLIRENYVLLQYVDTNIRDRWNIIMRWIFDADDRSNRTIAIVEYELEDHMELFAIGDYYSGDESTEFGSLLKYSVFSGVQFTF